MSLPTRVPPSLRRRGAVGLALAALVGATTLAAAGVGSAAPDDGERIPAREQSSRTSLVMVNAATPALRNRVIGLGLDYTEHATSTGIEVVLHGATDAETLRAAGFTWTTRVADLRAQARANALADEAYAERVIESPLPSGRTTYRQYGDYLRDLTTLAERYPALTRPLTLEGKTGLGQPIKGLEISTNADRVSDGKPIFLLMGAHHAREWPSSEHTIEFAFDLLQGYTNGRARAQRILRNERVIVVPVVNVDGFRISRGADRLGDFSQFDYEMKRKNCIISASTPAQYTGGTCDDNPAGRLRGTDINRNYPGFWGGGGASPNWSSDTFRGDGPGSDPESAAVRRLISKRPVTVMISNHTYSNLVLRPPAIAAVGRPPDEIQYKALGDAMADANQYTSQASYQLYDTSGSTEDWSYWNTGGYGFTIEIGTLGFHPKYADGVVAEYLGLAPAEGAGQGGNREAYYRAAEAAMDTAQHSRITGTAPKGYTLKIRKRFISQTSNVINADGSTGPPRYYADTLTNRYVSRGGAFTMNVNPSTRPVVVGRYGRDPQGPPQEALTLRNPAGVPAVGEQEQTTFRIQGLPDVDNGSAILRFEWPGGGEATDWDYTILDPEGEPIASAATAADPEVATIPDPVPGKYTVVAENYDGGSAETDWSGEVTFKGPEPATYSGLHEAYMLTCSDPTGRVVNTRSVIVDRGKVRALGQACNPDAAKR